MRVYIPSIGRSKLSDILAGPLAEIPPLHEVLFVVPPGEVGDYSDAIRQANLRHVRVVGCGERGIAATRKYIGEHARYEGVPKFVMMDDDVRFLVRKSVDVWNLRSPIHEEVTQMLAHVDQWLETHAHVGISPREGNNRVGVGGVGLVNENTRTLRVLAYRTEDFLSVEHGRVEVMEDFDVNLQLLERGLPNVCLYYWAQGQKMTNAPGGCSTYRSHEVHDRSARMLHELHPRYVSLRQKHNKTDANGFGTRTEVTIQWKKAYEESK